MAAATRHSFKPATGDDAATRSSLAEPRGDYRVEARSGEVGPEGWRNQAGTKEAWRGWGAQGSGRSVGAVSPCPGTGARLRTARCHPAPTSHVSLAPPLLAAGGVRI